MWSDNDRGDNDRSHTRAHCPCSDKKIIYGMWSLSWVGLEIIWNRSMGHFQGQTQGWQIEVPQDHKSGELHCHPWDGLQAPAAQVGRLLCIKLLWVYLLLLNSNTNNNKPMPITLLKLYYLTMQKKNMFFEAWHLVPLLQIQVLADKRHKVHSKRTPQVRREKLWLSVKRLSVWHYPKIYNHQSSSWTIQLD